jgi:eukaryotic-like serine/threonine-protein kinase
MIVEVEIARGGFGKVERVRLPDGSLVARKTFSPAMAFSSQADFEKLKSRFAREVKVQNSLNSKSFIPVLASGLTDAEPWYLMPLAERNFYEQIEMDRNTGSVPTSALADILNSLEELHQLGFVHRDLKPQNILLHDSVWKLTDFGLVLPPSSGTTKLTSMDSNWGTAAYCAPEQAIDFRGVTPAVDIYAFGCILHDIFANTARIPYQRQSVSGAIGSVIEKCTEQKPDKRFKNVQALRGALLTLLASASSITASPKASEWADSLKDISNWNLEKAYGFARFISQANSAEDKFAIYSSVDDDAFNALNSLDCDIWKHVAINYSDWVESTSFPFDYCDVLAKRLELIFRLGDLECKAAAVMATAELAESHNRWYVMGHVVKMCGLDIDDNEAQRIAIEILAADAAAKFLRCVEGIGREVTAFHPRIATVLAKKKP